MGYGPHSLEESRTLVPTTGKCQLSGPPAHRRRIAGPATGPACGCGTVAEAMQRSAHLPQSRTRALDQGVTRVGPEAVFSLLCSAVVIAHSTLGMACIAAEHLDPDPACAENPELGEQAARGGHPCAQPHRQGWLARGRRPGRGSAHSVRAPPLAVLNCRRLRTELLS